jgi:hypothetical protein
MIIVYGPNRGEPEDFAEEAMLYVENPRWQVEVAVDFDLSERTISHARALARHLAVRSKGVALDPQEGTILWPRKPLRPLLRREDERIDLIKLVWFLPQTSASVNYAAAFLNCLRLLCPEALPVRYGTYTPLQGRVKPGNDAPFLAAWKVHSRTSRSDPLRGLLFLESSKPCFGGHISFSAPPEDDEKNTSDRVEISLDFDARPIFADESWRERLVNLFLGVSRELNAFHAIGVVERAAILSRGKIWWGEKTERYPLPTGSRWCGIPPSPSWLTWFGSRYSSLVRESLKENGVRRYPEGLFLRLGHSPTAANQLRSVYPQLPASLLVRLGKHRRPRVATIIPKLG